MALNLDSLNVFENIAYSFSNNKNKLYLVMCLVPFVMLCSLVWAKQLKPVYLQTTSDTMVNQR